MIHFKLKFNLSSLQGALKNSSIWITFCLLLFTGIINCQGEHIRNSICRCKILNFSSRISHVEFYKKFYNRHIKSTAGILERKYSHL